MQTTLPFLVQLTADRRYVNIRVPVNALPEELRRRPSNFNVRLVREQPDAERPWQWVPPFLLALVAK